jgi:hypothetical protein
MDTNVNNISEVSMRISKFGAMIAILVLFNGIGIAAQAPGANPKKVVSPRALITQVEIAEYRRAVRSAPTREAAQGIREATYARLRQRAADRGMVMSEPQPWYGGLHWGEVLGTKEATPAPERKPVAVPHEHPAMPTPHHPAMPIAR